MKITSNKSYDVGCRTNNLPNQQPNLDNKAARSGVSFGSAKSTITKTFDFIDRKGFFTEFLIVDSLSLIIPRIIIGLNRDKDETGHLNYKAGIEETGREVISGPSMFLIPIGMFTALKHIAPAAKIPRLNMNEISCTMEDVVKETSDLKILNNKEKLNKNLAEKLFDKAFGDFKLNDKNKLKSEFVELLNKPKEKMADFKNLIVRINNSNKAKITLDTETLNINKTQIKSEFLFEDYKHYSDDIIDKFSKQNFVKDAIQNSKDSAIGFLEKLQKNRRGIRAATSFASYLAVGGFLLILPKLYLQSKISPAMESAKRARAEAKQGGENEN